ncbi:MAG: hypothetical protein M0Q90_09510 [Bacteroidales bacterium]|nr:hypothetical protein [Bacteroidales bacterium]
MATFSKLSIGVCLILLTAITTFAQSIKIIVNVIPPISNDLSSFVDNPNKILIQVINGSAEMQSLKFHAKMTGDNGVYVNTKENYVPNQPFKLQAFETRMVNISELVDYGNSSDFDYGGIDVNQLIRTRKLPEGNYTFCLEAYNYNSPGFTMPLSDGYPAGCAYNLQLVTLDPPQIISVGMGECGDVLAPATPQLVNIMWFPPAGLYKMIKYNIQMVEVIPSNREINDAIFTNSGPLFLDEWVQSTVFTINSTHQQLNLGAKYAFRVQAVDPEELITFRNDGYSQVCSFSWGIEESFSNSNFSQNIIFPQSVDTLPFINIPIAAPWAPFDNYLSQLSTQVSLSNNAVTVGNRMNNFNFSPNLVAYASGKCGGATVPVDEIQMYVSPSAPSYFTGANLTKGTNYDIELISNFQIKNDPSEQILVSTGSYHYGMPTPKSVSPENDAVSEPGSQVFSVRTGQVVNPFLNGQLSRLGNATEIYDYLTSIKVDETLVFELSEDADFAVLANRQTRRMEYERSLNEISLLYDSVFKVVHFEVPELTDGVYYWRVKYLKQAANTNENAASYRTGETRKITIGGSSGTAGEPCLASDCSSAPVPQDRRVAVASLNIGSWLKMGEFDLLVSSVTQSQNSTFSGEGVVLINPFPTGNSVAGFYPVKVAFENLRFNSSKQVFEGSARTVSLAQNPWNQVSGTALPQGNDIGILKNLCEGAPTAIAAPTSAEASYYLQNASNTPFALHVIKTGLVSYDFSILGVQFTPVNANINCAITTTALEENQSYTFMAANLCLKPAGWASEVIEMNLLGDVNFNFLGSDIKIEGFKNNQAYSKAVWDCSGFRHLKLVGNVQFSREMLRPVNGNYNSPDNRLTGFFDTEVVSLEDVIYSVSIQEPYHFALAGKSLKVESPIVFIDRSESQNPTGLAAPVGYTGVIDNTWNGIFFPTLEIEIDLFENQVLQANNFFFDGMMTGRILGTNIFDINQQTVGNMNISLDTVDINLVQNNFRKYHFAGKINPRLNETFTLNYLMDYDLPDVNGQSNIHGRVLMDENLNLPLDFIYSTFVVSDNSTLIFDKIGNDPFRPVLTLNGNLSLQGDFDNIGEVNLPQMEVSEMKLRTNPGAGEKYFDLGTFSFSSPQKNVGGFNITITDVENIYNSNFPREFGMNFIYRLNLGATAETFSVVGNFGIKAKAEIIDRKLDYSFKGVSFDSLSINGNLSVADFEGKLYFFKNHATYGNGLQGRVSANFEPGVSLLAKAYFGKVKVGQSTHQYWGVFGGVRFDNPVPVMGVIDCSGFAGGIYYNMKNPQSGNPNPRRVQEPNASNIAVTLVPEVNSTGFAAKVWLESAAGGDAFKSMSTIGAEFNSNSWSLNRLFLEGNLWIMPENNTDVPVWADLNVNLDTRARSLSGTFDGYIKHWSLEGTQSNYKAGSINMFISANRWWVYVGTPGNRIGVSVPAIGADLNGYLCIGNPVPDIPALPQAIRDVLTGTTIGNFRDSNVQQGKGFVFGASFDLDPPAKTVLGIRGDIRLLLGFDLSLIKYTDEVSCDGVNPVTNLGINNWYAQGQIYAYVYASLGIHVDVWFAEGTFNIFRGEAGAALASGLPNPTWATGAIGGRYRILGGAIKGSFSYEFTVGEVCRPTQIVDNPVADLKIIESINLNNNARDVSPFVSITTALNFKPDQIFSIELVTDEDETYTRTFRARLSPQIKRGSTNISVRNNVLEEGTGDDLYYSLETTPTAVLVGNTRYQLQLNAFFEERKNAQWAVAKSNSGQEVRQNMLVNFTTGALPDRIPASVVKSSVPVEFDNYFKVLGKFSSTGTVINKRFEMIFTQNVKDSYFYDSASQVLPDPLRGGTYIGKVPVKYMLRVINLNTNSKQDYDLRIYQNAIKYNQQILQQILLPNTKYKLEVIRKKELPLDFINDQLNFGQQVSVNYQNVGNNANLSIEKRKLTLQSNGANFIDHIDDVEFRLFEIYVKTSKFNSIYDKVQQLQLVSNQRDASYRVLTFKFNTQERFSAMEMENEVKLLDMYAAHKQYFAGSDRQYDIYSTLKQKAVGTPFAPWLGSPEPFIINTSPTRVENAKHHYINPTSTVNYTTRQRFLGQPNEPANSEVQFVANYEQLVSIDRPGIQNYCTNYLTLLNNISPDIYYYNQVRLSGTERLAVQNIIMTSWTKRMGIYFENSYVPDPSQYNLLFRMLEPDGSTGGSRNITYHLN